MSTVDTTPVPSGTGSPTARREHPLAPGASRSGFPGGPAASPDPAPAPGTATEVVAGEGVTAQSAAGDAARLRGAEPSGAGRWLGSGSAEVADAGTMPAAGSRVATRSALAAGDAARPGAAEPAGAGRRPGSGSAEVAGAARVPGAGGTTHSTGAGAGGALRGAGRTPQIVRSRFDAYGTYGELLLAGRPAALGTAVRVLRAELDAIDVACSRFRDDSELAAVNAAAGRAVVVSAMLAEAVEVALTAAAQTGGDVDPTLGAALVAAGYDGDYETLPADRPAAAPAPPPAGAWRDVELDHAAGTLRVPAGTALDLGATAKALAVDRAAAAIATATGAGVLVNVGGDIAAAGPVPAGGWPVRLTDDTERIGVTRPGGAGPVVRLHGGGLATSSTAVRRWRRGGRTYHHVLDPRTGLPAEPVWRTVTVTAASCVDANTASTAAIVRGRGAPSWLAELGLPSRLVDAAGAVHRVAGWPPDRHPDAGPGEDPSGREGGG